MKILIAAHFSENRVTGVGRYLNHLIPSLIELDGESEYVVVLRSDLEQSHPLLAFTAPNLRKIFVSLHSGPGIRHHLSLARIVWRENPDVFHYPHFDLSLFQRARSVVTVHDLKYIMRPDFLAGPGKLKAWYIKFALGLSLKRSSHVIAVSTKTKEDLLRLYHVAEDKVTVIHHGIALNRTDPGEETGGLSKDFTGEEQFILFVGERRPHKNIENLIKAFEMCRQRRGAVKLVIVGKSYADYKEPERLVERMDLQDDILFTGYVNDRELHRLYRHATIFILPSFYEGFGIPVFEAMSHGVPVIASKTSCIPDIAGDSALYIDPDDTEDIASAIADLLSDHEKQKQLSERGKQRVQELSWSRAAEQTVRVYHQLREQ